MAQDQGFTLIELLIVTAIIGVLAAIAIPAYSTYRERGYDTAAHSDLRNLITAQEAYFADFNRYASTTAIDGFTPSNGVQFTVNGNNSGFSATTSHPLGSQEYSYDSNGLGGITASIPGPP